MLECCVCTDKQFLSGYESQQYCTMICSWLPWTETFSGMSQGGHAYASCLMYRRAELVVSAQQVKEAVCFARQLVNFVVQVNRALPNSKCGVLPIPGKS